MESLSVLGLVILLMDVYVILQIAQSPTKTIGKAIWIAIVLALPFLGLIIWYFAGPGKKPF